MNIIDGSLNTGNDNPFSNAMIKLCGVFSQLERDLIKALSEEGRAKAKGVHLGRVPSLSDKQAKELLEEKLNGDTILVLVRKYNVSRATVNFTPDRVSDES
ncbi:MAG: DNA invertase Pin-like site-specific DNA recombinase [Cognaticolwellia sp.]